MCQPVVHPKLIVRITGFRRCRKPLQLPQFERFAAGMSPELPLASGNFLSFKKNFAMIPQTECRRAPLVMEIALFVPR